MLDNTRYNEALESSANYEGDINQPWLQIFLDEEFRTQEALRNLDATKETPPSQIPEINRIHINPKLLSGLPANFIVEFLGMPRAGKTTVIQACQTTLGNSFQGLEEGTKRLVDWQSKYKYDDPFLYHVYTSIETMRLFDIAKQTPPGRIFLQDRGLVDRKIFRRSLFIAGQADPSAIKEEADIFKMYPFTPPYGLGFVILCLVRPDIAIFRDGPRDKQGSIINKQFLGTLYEQYLRFHEEVLSQKRYYPAYLAIDMEQDSEKVQAQIETAIQQVVSQIK
jgi:hypothetical protein